MCIQKIVEWVQSSTAEEYYIGPMNNRQKSARYTVKFEPIRTNVITKRKPQRLEVICSYIFLFIIRMALPSLLESSERLNI